MVEGPRRKKRGERYFKVFKNKINYENTEKTKHKIAFDNLTPLYNKQLVMEVIKLKSQILTSVNRFS